MSFYADLHVHSKYSRATSRHSDLEHLVRFMLEVEISTIYKKGERTRKIHHLIYTADLDTAQSFRERLGRIGNIASDRRRLHGKVRDARPSPFLDEIEETLLTRRQAPGKDPRQQLGLF